MHDNSARAAHADALYEALERSHAASPPKRQPLELPESHALSWVHSLVDWEDVFEEGSRLYGIVRARHKLRETGASHAEIVREHSTSPQVKCKHCSGVFCGGATRIRQHFCDKCTADTPAFLEWKLPLTEALSACAGASKRLINRMMLQL